MTPTPTTQTGQDASGAEGSVAREPWCEFCASPLDDERSAVCRSCNHFRRPWFKWWTRLLTPANSVAALALVLAFWQARVASVKASNAEIAVIKAESATKQAVEAQRAAESGLQNAEEAKRSAKRSLDEAQTANKAAARSLHEALDAQSAAQASLEAAKKLRADVAHSVRTQLFATEELFETANGRIMDALWHHRDTLHERLRSQIEGGKVDADADRDEVLKRLKALVERFSDVR